MKKLFTTLVLLLACTAMSYASITIYVRAGVTPYIHAWTTSGDLDSWPGTTMTWVKWCDTNNLYKFEFEESVTKVSITISNNGANQTSDITDLTEDTYIDYNKDDGSYTILTEDATMSSVILSGSFDNWETGQSLTKVSPESELVWTTTLDCSTSIAGVDFKFRPNGTTWLGYDSSMIIDAPDGWITDDGSNNHNYKLNTSITGYNTFKFTATWVKNRYEGQNWTLKVEGLEARPYSIVGMETSGEGEGWARDWDMEATETAGEYKVVKEFEIPSAGTYQYKLRSNHAWSIYELPGNANATYEFKDAGKYRLTFVGNIINHTVNLSAEKIVELNSIGKGTFASNHTCDFSSVEGLAAYAISEISGNSAILTQVTGVPNGNGVILIGAPNGKYNVPFGDAASLGSTNLLVAVTDANGHTVENDGDVYILHTDGALHPAYKGTIPFGKAYLPKAEVGNAPFLSLVFGNETTGISNIKAAERANGGFFNLAGQRVAQPTKGLYIVNGRKVVIK